METSEESSSEEKGIEAKNKEADMRELGDDDALGQGVATEEGEEV